MKSQKIYLLPVNVLFQKGNRDKLKIYKVRLVMAQPLMFDGTWLQQGKYESAEARYQKFLAGTLQSQVSQPPLFGGTCTLPHLGKSESETRNQQVIAETVQLQVVEPLLFDGTWLQQGKYESAEAHYQQILAGTTTCRSQRKNVHVRKVSLSFFSETTAHHCTDISLTPFHHLSMT